MIFELTFFYFVMLKVNMMKKTVRKSKTSKKSPRKSTKKSSKIHKVKEFLKGKTRYVPHILAGATIAYLWRGVYNIQQLRSKLEKYYLIHNVNPYEKLGIKKDISLEDFKKQLKDCYRETHQDRIGGRRSEKFEFCTSLRDFLRSEGIKV